MDRFFRKILIREIPIFAWVLGALMTAGGIYIAIFMSDICMGIVFAGFGLVLFLGAYALVVELNWSSNHLIIRRIGVLKRTTEEFPVREIQSIDVRPTKYSNLPVGDKTVFGLTYRGRRNHTTYEVVVVKENGDVIQLYIGASFTMLKIARRLREELGVGGEDRR